MPDLSCRLPYFLVNDDVVVNYAECVAAIDGVVTDTGQVLVKCSGRARFRISAA